jgi:hypothetical protein
MTDNIRSHSGKHPRGILREGVTINRAELLHGSDRLLLAHLPVFFISTIASAKALPICPMIFAEPK